MRVQSTTFAALLSVAAVNAQGSFTEWHPAGAGDSRGPCPGLNTLANHGFLPHNGRNFTIDIMKKGLRDSLNFTDALTQVLFNAAITTNPEAGAQSFGLDTLSRHNILEHDASLSRSDKFFSADFISFNSTVFEKTKAIWTGDNIDIQMAANARIARINESKKDNPEFEFSATAAQASAAEGAAYMLGFGNRSTNTANKAQVVYFFENERLPIELGWKTPSQEITPTDLVGYTAAILKATPAQAKRRDGMVAMQF
ncbi:Chloroperoxidase [Pyrenophora seminiperda CCB06]|uniref:Chloroperoxidase n=1 Tax=Pyrenophora seminiperda CCB06 TaxID=1302712 RepID=A0A3M7MFF4_9PLEO|nr:Chloroperoxidase [Pyrenophora seminiperda CCB06]